MDLPQIETSRKTVCRMLRTKTYFSRYAHEDGGQHDWSSGESTTAAYWCLATMASVGPDDGFVHPSDCCDARVCFKPELT